MTARFLRDSNNTEPRVSARANIRGKTTTPKRVSFEFLGTLAIFSCAILLAAASSSSAEQPPSGATDAKDILVLKAATLYVGDGRRIEDGMIVIRDGLIVDIGAAMATPAGARVIEIEGGSITPGLIDANAAVESEDLVAPLPRGPRAVLHGLFHPGHTEAASPGCCGSSCPRAIRHVDGTRCQACGFPDAQPSAFAVGTRMSANTAEASSEVIPEMRVIDSVNLRSRDFDRLMRGGVTTVYTSPSSAAVIGAQGAIVRTGGAFADRIVRETYAVKAAMGVDPSRRGRGNSMPSRRSVTFHTRRPGTRMGVAWVFRKALHDTKRGIAGLDVYGADAPGEASREVLARVLAGEVPLRIQARAQHDILAAIRLTEEFGLSFTLEEGTDAYRCIDELEATGTPVVFGPIYVTPVGWRAFGGEVRNARVHTLRVLIDAGIETALSAHELRDEDGLARQAMYAIRFGVSLDDALAAVTAVPARLLGIDDIVGTLEVGKRADLVIWSGEPFDAVSAPRVVLIGGEVVVDTRDG